ncbi:MAG: ArsC/Spx/MgsR family protein [Pseudomonadota bacterium]
MKLYGLKNCDTCRKALKALEAAGKTVEFVDVRADGVPKDALAVFHTAFGDALLNTRSTTWRGLDDAERARPALELLADYPTLMKRPVIEDGAKAGDTRTLGWTKETQAQWLS